MLLSKMHNYLLCCSTTIANHILYKVNKQDAAKFEFIKEVGTAVKSKETSSYPVRNS